MIFYRRGVRGTDKKGHEVKYDIEDKINFAVFPGLQVTFLVPAALFFVFVCCCKGPSAH